MHLICHVVVHCNLGSGTLLRGLVLPYFLSFERKVWKFSWSSYPDRSKFRRLTPLAFRHFPSGHFSYARKRFFSNRDLYDDRGTFPRIPSLVELLLYHHRVSPYCEITDNVSSQRARAINVDRPCLWANCFELIHLFITITRESRTIENEQTENA